MLSKAIFLSAYLLSVATSFASAGYTITYPGAGVVLNAGEQVTVKWTVSGTVENKIDLRLVHGPAENLSFDFNVCSDVDPNAGKCQFTVSNKIPSGIDYALTAGKLPENFGYSSFFTIKAQGPLPENKGCPNMGGKNCPNSLPCCSSSGYCGSTEAYCGTGCVPKFSFGGICAQPGTSPKTTAAASPKTTAAATPVTTPTPSPKPSKPKQKKCGKKMCSRKSPCCNKNTCGNKCGKGCKSAYSFAGKCAKPKTKRDQF